METKIMPLNSANMADEDMMLDHVALECMHALESKDKDAFMDALHVLVADLLMKMQSEPDEDKEA